MKIKFFENLQYMVLAGLIIAQCVIGGNFYLGQSIYLAVNIISIIRSFALERPISDKVKDISCFAITFGIIAFSLLTNAK